jgi:predicted CXXCH cytochrome family protein
MKKVFFLLITILPFFYVDPVLSARGDLGDENIKYTKHNLSSFWPADAGADIRTVKSATQNEVCVFCHTPHGSTLEDLGGGVKAPLWNRKLSTASHFLYDEVWSPTLEAYRVNVKPSAPTGYSKLCLSCHDGTLAIGNVYNAPGSGGYSSTGTSAIPLTGTDTGGTMPVGGGRYSGDTRLIGTNLSNDHPVSFIFDTNLYNADKELATPSTVVDPVTNKTLLYSGAASTRNNVQCTSCHNPHTTYEKFLRMSRWQTGGGATQRQICLNCHNKPGWTGSSHQIATKTFNATVPASNAGLEGRQMTQAGCLACHDTHTIQGAERLLRDAVDTAAFTAGGNSVAGSKTSSAIENLCFRCHSRSSASLSTPHGLMDSNAQQPKDIWSQFNKTSRMPIADTASQGNHQPIFTFSQPTDATIPTGDPKTNYERALLGVVGAPSSVYKHLECVDCHNPHRVTSSTSASLSGIDRLAGMRGIRTDGTVMQSVANSGATGTYRNMVEISEVCFRCHGDTYDTFIPTRYDSYLRRLTSGSVVNESHPTRSTANNPASNNTHGSSKKKEFNPNTTFPLGGTGSLNYNAAYHPVAATGRNQTGVFDPANSTRYGLLTASGLSRNNTINCTDCHNTNALGAGTFTGTTATPTFAGAITESSLRSYTESGRTLSDLNRGPAFYNNLSATEAKGPHGSSNNRILRANYNTTLATGISSTNTAGSPPFNTFDAANFALCFNCHNIDAFANASSIRTNFRMSGFMCGGALNLHVVHLNDGGGGGGMGGMGGMGGGMGMWDAIAGMYTACANCHYNVHSNVEASNTIYGDGNGGALPSHGGTRLVNFSPIIQPNAYSKPRWWYDGANMRCDMRCHNNVIMSGAGGGMGGMGGGGGGIEAVYNYFGN